jgi:hypothetical protein
VCAGLVLVLLHAQTRFAVGLLPSVRGKDFSLPLGGRGINEKGSSGLVERGSSSECNYIPPARFVAPSPYFLGVWGGVGVVRGLSPSESLGIRDFLCLLIRVLLKSEYISLSIFGRQK